METRLRQLKTHLDCLDAAGDILQADLRLLDQSAELLDETLPIELFAIAQDSLAAIPNLLKVSPIFLLEEWDQTPQTTQKMVVWRMSAGSLVKIASQLLKTAPSLSRDVSQDLLIGLSRLCGNSDDPWIDKVTAETARASLKHMLSKMDALGRTELLLGILKGYLRSCFIKTAHPSVNRNTGRKLNRPAESLNSSREDTAWKGRDGHDEAIGCWNVLACCIALWPRKDLEDQWHLIVPPLMTLMDDHEIPFRLRGLNVAQILLEKSDPSFLRRTSLDQLVQLSLSTSLSFLTDTSYAPFVAKTVTLNLYLIDKMDPAPESIQEISLARFDALSRLIKEGPLHIYLYVPEKVVFSIIAADTIIAVANRLGIGMLRHVQDLLNPLLAALGFPSAPTTPQAFLLYSKTSIAVATLIKVCAPVIERWRNKILASVLTCWTLLGESSKGNKADKAQLEEDLKTVVDNLVKACGKVVLADLREIDKLEDSNLRRLYAKHMTADQSETVAEEK